MTFWFNTTNTTYVGTTYPIFWFKRWHSLSILFRLFSDVTLYTLPVYFTLEYELSSEPIHPSKSYSKLPSLIMQEGKQRKTSRHIKIRLLHTCCKILTKLLMSKNLTNLWKIELNSIFFLFQINFIESIAFRHIYPISYIKYFLNYSMVNRQIWDFSSCARSLWLAGTRAKVQVQVSADL